MRSAAPLLYELLEAFPAKSRGFRQCRRLSYLIFAWCTKQVQRKKIRMGLRKAETWLMLDTITFAAGLLFLLGGVLLLYDGFYDWSVNQSAFVVVGAGLFALGLVTVSHVGWKRWQWKRQFKNDE